MSNDLGYLYVGLDTHSKIVVYGAGPATLDAEFAAKSGAIKVYGEDERRGCHPFD